MQAVGQMQPVGHGHSLPTLALDQSKRQKKQNSTYLGDEKVISDIQKCRESSGLFLAGEVRFDCI